MFSEKEYLAKYQLIDPNTTLHLEIKMEVGNFLALIDIKDGDITGKIMDMDYNDEYINYRIDYVEGFPSLVKNEYLEILDDIKDKYYKPMIYRYPQSNRIARRIYDKYHDEPIFKWGDKFEDSVFENPLSHKWYVLVAYINAYKPYGIDNNVELIDIKLEKDEIIKLLDKKGFYPAYHMNKKSWITIILDDTLSDDIIMEYIDKSYQLSIDKNKLSNNIWIAPANPNMYDVSKVLDTPHPIWKKIASIKIGDIIYIYITKPIGAVKYKLEVVSLNETFYDMPCIGVKVIRKYNDNHYDYNFLKSHGLSSIRGARRINKELDELLSN